MLKYVFLFDYKKSIKNCTCSEGSAINIIEINYQKKKKKTN